MSTHDHILLHYRKEEQAFVERVIEWTERVSNTHVPIRTDFIDPRQREIIKNIVNSNMDLTMFFDGGYDGAERGRALIAPDYWTYQSEEMGLGFLKVVGSNRFDQLAHKDYMGALLNIGIKREKFGDIILFDDHAQYILSEEVVDFVKMQLIQIKRTKINLEDIKREQLNPITINLNISTYTISSLRSDAVLSQLIHLSRTKVVELIKRKHLKVNWQVIDKIDFALQAGDLISIKGYGRFKVIEIGELTKKDKIRVKIGKMV